MHGQCPQHSSPRIYIYIYAYFTQLRGIPPAKHSEKMATLKLLFSLVVLTSTLSIHHASYSSFEGSGINVLESNKVNLSLYYESLCPACRSFIVDELAAALFDPDKDLISITNLRLVPYGNAHVQAPNQTVVCQVTFPIQIFTIFSFSYFCSWIIISLFASYSAAWPRRMLLQQYRSLCNRPLVRRGKAIFDLSI